MAAWRRDGLESFDDRLCVAELGSVVFRSYSDLVFCGGMCDGYWHHYDLLYVSVEFALIVVVALTRRMSFSVMKTMASRG